LNYYIRDFNSEAAAFLRVHLENKYFSVDLELSSCNIPPTDGIATKFEGIIIVDTETEDV
jgi:hypothetical protein